MRTYYTPQAAPAKAALLPLCLLLAATGAACTTSAANMAAKQPERIDLSILKKGAPKNVIVARLGAAASTSEYGTKPDHTTTEVYAFIQGYSGATRTARVFGHSVLTTITMGLWEPTGQAIEGYARGTKVGIQVTYDRHDRVLGYCILEGHDAISDELDPGGLSPHCRPTPAPMVKQGAPK